MLRKVSRRLDQAVAKEMAPFQNIVLEFDGWGKALTQIHYVALFAHYPINDGHHLAFLSPPLLTFSPLLDEESQSAAAHLDWLNSSLALYGKSMENDVAAVLADNCNTNRCICTKVQPCYVCIHL